MPAPLTSEETERRRSVVADFYLRGEPLTEAARVLGIRIGTLREWVSQNGGPDTLLATAPLAALGYDTATPERRPEDAWAAGTETFDRTLSKAVAKRGRTVKRPRGPVVIFHSTDEHVDDNATPLRLIEHDVNAAKDLNAVMCHGGDLLNN